MAGIAALMNKRTRKERERKRHESLQMEETGFTEVIKGKEGKTTPGAISEKSVVKSPTSLKKAIVGEASVVKKKIDRKLEGSFNTRSRDHQRLLENTLAQSYTPVYLGFVFISIGLVITFVGLGDKGFRTVELRLIGPSLCIFGVSCILFKIIQCHFPRLFILPHWLKKARLADTENPNLIEKGLQNGHLGGGSNSRINSPQVLSPRVILQSTRQIPRPKSTIPNYIEDSSDDDDFDSGNHHHHHHRGRPSALTHHHQYQSYEEKRDAEIILNPKSLML